MPDASKASVIAARLAWLADTTRRTPTAEGRDVTLDALLVCRPFSLGPSPALPQPASASATRAATATCSKRVRRASKLHPAAAPAMLLDAPLSSMTVLASRPSGRAATPGCRRRNDGVGPVPGSPEATIGYRPPTERSEHDQHPGRRSRCEHGRRRSRDVRYRA